jgi:hypothetical protein
MFVSIDAAEIEEVVGQMVAVSNAALRVALAGIVELDQREAWRVDGAHSMASWLEMRHGLSATTARQWVRVARGLVFCPELAATFEAGHLSWDQLMSSIDLVAFTSLADADVAADAVGRTSAELDRLARDARRLTRDDAQARHRERYLRMRWEREGTLRLHGRLSDVEGKAFELAIRRGADDQPTDPTCAVLRPIEERQADALHDLVSARLAADADPDLATVVVHVEADAVLGPDAVDDDDDGLASIQLGPVISRSTVLRLCCDGRIQLVVDGPMGETVHVARTVHAVPRWARRKALHRDGGCRWPGCGRTALLHVHHIRWWSRGGLTEDMNLVALCHFHHRLVHEGGWKVEGNPFGRLRFIRPDGHALSTGPPGLRDDVRKMLGLAPRNAPPVRAA